MGSDADNQGPKPTYIYKLVHFSTPPPEPLPDALPVSDLDSRDRFLHMSTQKQVPRTLAHFFKDDPKVYVLRVPYEGVEKLVKWEDPKGEVCGPRAGEGMFPHIYNGLKLGKEEVESVAVWENSAEGWDAAVKKAEESGWFVF